MQTPLSLINQFNQPVSSIPIQSKSVGNQQKRTQVISIALGLGLGFAGIGFGVYSLSSNVKKEVISKVASIAIPKVKTSNIPIIIGSSLAATSLIFLAVLATPRCQHFIVNRVFDKMLAADVAAGIKATNSANSSPSYLDDLFKDV